GGPPSQAQGRSLAIVHKTTCHAASLWRSGREGTGGPASGDDVRLISASCFLPASRAARQVGALRVGTPRIFEGSSRAPARASTPSLFALQVFKVTTVAFRRHQLAWNEAHGCRVDTVSQAAALNGAV